MAAELIVIGPTTGAAYSYARQLHGSKAPDRCFVPVAPFSLSQFAYMTKSLPPVLVLPGSKDREDWTSWESVMKACKLEKVDFL